MEAKKVYQISLVLCGLFLALSGIACLVVGTLLDRDSDLRRSHESRSRAYATQYWLGLPVIAFGGALMLMSPSMHRRKTLAALSLVSCIPLITCALAGSILHGTAYTHFLSIRQHRLYLEDHFYLCAEDIQDDSVQCRCIKPGDSESNGKTLPVPCDQQNSLVSFHGALLTFSAVAFSLLLGILVICVILLPQFLKLQLSVGETASSGQVNEGFSHARGRTHSIDVYSDVPASPFASQTTLHINDHPPSYESLLTSFNMTSRGIASHNTSQDTIATRDVATERNMAAPLNRQARVRYRGELSSNQIPMRIDQRESSPNDELLLSANRLENSGTVSPIRVSIIQNRPGGPIPRRTSQNRQGSHELNPTTSNENRRVVSNETSRQQTTLNGIHEPNNEANIEIRSGRNARPSLEGSGEREEENSSNPRIRNSNPLAEQSSYNNVPGTFQPSPIQRSTNVQVAREESNHTHLSSTEQTPTLTERPPTMEPEREVISDERNIRNPSHSTDDSSDTVSHDLTMMDHTPLGPTVSNNSEDGVYIDITRSPAHHSNSAPSVDSSRNAVRYRGQNVIQSESDADTDENVQENLQKTTHQDQNSLNSVNSNMTEQTANHLTNNATETASANIGNTIGEEESPNAAQRGGESSSSESDVATNHADTNSVSSLEIMSI